MKALYSGGTRFLPPVPDGSLSLQQLRFRGTILVCEHGVKQIKTEKGTYRTLRDASHKKGALGNLVLTSTFSPDYDKHGLGFTTMSFDKASPSEKKEAERLAEKFGLEVPSIVSRLGLTKGGKVKYYSYFVFADGADSSEYNTYFEQRFPNSQAGPVANRKAIESYGGYAGYYDFFMTVWNSFSIKEIA